MTTPRSTAWLNWTLGIAAGISMVVAVFLPWFDDVWARGITDSRGLLALGLAVVVVCNWLGSAGLRVRAALSAAGIGLWTLAQSDAQWGLFIFCGTALIAAVSSISVGANADTADGRRAIREWVNTKLNPGDGDSKAVDTFIIGLIGVNVLLVIIETEPASAEWSNYFEVAEALSTLIFSVEYVLRLWIAPLDPRYQHRLKGASNTRVRRWPSSISWRSHRFPRLLCRKPRPPYRPRHPPHATGPNSPNGTLRPRSDHALPCVRAQEEELAIANFVSIMVLILCSSVMYFVENEGTARSLPKHPRSDVVGRRFQRSPASGTAMSLQ